MGSFQARLLWRLFQPSEPLWLLLVSYLAAYLPIGPHPAQHVSADLSDVLVERHCHSVVAVQRSWYRLDLHCTLYDVFILQRIDDERFSLAA
jgi:hypothetical protein